MKSKRLLILLVIVILIMGVVALDYYVNLPNVSSECNSLFPSGWPYYQIGLSHTCSVGQVSDGRLSIAFHNYHFAQTKDIQFNFSSDEQAPGPYEVFLVVNVSIANIGGGNTSIGGRGRRPC